MPFTLGIDVGTTFLKALLLDEEGRVRKVASAGYDLRRPQRDFVEQDPEDWWKALVEAVREAVEGVPAREVKALALATQGDTLVPTGEDGEALCPALSWMDRRAGAECEELLAIRPQEWWFGKTGKKLLGSNTASKVRWLQRHRPDIAERARFCNVHDHLVRRMTGTFATDATNASWTTLFDIEQRVWDADILDLLGLSEERVSPIVSCGEPIAPLAPGAANELGLTPETVVAGGAFDQVAATYGAGVTGANEALLSCGTAWVLFVVTTRPVLDERLRLPACCFVGDDEWGLVCAFTGGAAYDWLREAVKRDHLEAEPDGPPLIFLPYFYGEVSPGWNPAARGALIGLSLEHTAEHLQLALMRALAFEARRNLEVARGLSVSIESLKMAGGAAQSAIWPQIVADVMGLPITLPVESECAARGAALLAAKSVGLDAPEATPHEPAREVLPDPARARRYEELYGCYNAARESLADVFRMLGELRRGE
ncbi:MAG: FGGY-family carbohydrate kinase [Armatimonadota bacterium]